MNTADAVRQLEQETNEDEQTAREATGGRWEVGPTFGARDTRVYVKPEGPGIDTIGTCVIAAQVSNMPECRGNARHIARHDPDRTLRDVAARRAIIRMYHNAVADQQAESPSAWNRAQDDAAISILGEVIHLLSGHTPPGRED